MGDFGAAAQAGAQVATAAAEIAFAADQAKKARAREREIRRKMDAIESNRPEVINPYEDLSSRADMIQDLSGMASNPYANVAVATQTAERNIEEQDINLANTLEALQQGQLQSASATALSQAALEGKQGVMANLEQQEAKNELLRAEGQAGLERLRMAEAQRVQAGLFGEEGRMQEAGVLGKEFVYGETERRAANDLNRYASLISGAMAVQSDANKALGSGLQGLRDVDYGAFAGKKKDTGGGGSPAPSTGGGGGTGGFAGGGFMGSDRKLKKNIKLIGKSKQGIIFQGAMADEVNPNAVIEHPDGYKMIDYSMIDVEFKKIK